MDRNTLLSTVMWPLAVVGTHAASNASAQDVAEAVETQDVAAAGSAVELFEIPVAITVVDKATIERETVLNLEELAALVPALSVTTETASGAVTIRLRGIGTSSDNFALEPSVATFVDGVYRARQGATVFDFLDVEQVEVLRGPQLTTYGRNAVQGVVSITTGKPEFEPSASSSVLVGSDGHVAVEGVATGALVKDKLAFRIAGNYRQRDGFIDNVANDQELDNINRYGLRGSMLFKPQNDLSILAEAERFHLDEDCCGMPFITELGDYYETVFASVDTVPVSTDPFDRLVSSGDPATSEITTDAYKLEINKSFGLSAIKSTSAYVSYEETRSIDGDRLQAAVLVERPQQNEYTEFSQEVRVDHSFEFFDVMGGLYFYDQDLSTGGSTVYGADARNLVGGYFNLNPPLTPEANEAVVAETDVLFGLPIGTTLGEGLGDVGSTYDVETQSWALFAQTNIYATDKLTFTLGARLGEEEKSASADVNINDPYSSINMVDVGVVSGFSVATLGALAPTPENIVAFAVANPEAFVGIYEAALDPSINFARGFESLQIFLPNDGSTVDGQERTDEFLTWNATAEYQFTNQFSTYVNYATGYKPGGFNLDALATGFLPSAFYDLYTLSGGTQPPASTAPTAEFEEETSQTFELGFKGRAMSDRLVLNGALFLTEIEDFQFFAFDGIRFRLENSGSIEMAGIELDGKFQLTEEVSFSGAWTHLFDRTYGSFENGPCIAFAETSSDECNTNLFEDLTGENVAGTQENNVVVTAEWAPTIGQYPSFIRSTYSFVGETNIGAGNDPNKFQDAYGLLNINAGVSSPQGRVHTQFWVRNALDEEYLTHAVDVLAAPGLVNARVGAPRTYGATLRISW